MADAWSTLYVIVATLAECRHTRDDPLGFVAALAELRYGAILATNVLGDPPWGTPSAVCNPAVQAVGLASALPGAVHAYAKPVCSAADELPSHTAGLWIGNWVESVATLALRRPESVGHLLALTRPCSCGNGLPHCPS